MKLKVKRLTDTAKLPTKAKEIPEWMKNENQVEDSELNDEEIKEFEHRINLIREKNGVLED